MKNGLFLPCDTDLYCITAEEYSNGRSNIDVVRDIIASNVKIIQYREKEKPLREKYEQCISIREMTKKSSVTFIVNDNIDLALAVDADGVHIGQDDLPVSVVRKLVGDKIIGVSTHSPEQMEKAAADGADYIGAGPVFPTKTKKNVCNAVGLSYIDHVSRNSTVPFVAIGGIKDHNVEEVLKHGAGCVAMVTEIVSSSDIPRLIHSIRSKMGTIKW